MLTLTFEGRWKELLNVAMRLEDPGNVPLLVSLPLAAVTERLLHLLPMFHGMHMPHSIGEAAVGERRDLRPLRHMCVHHASAHSSPLLLAEEARPHDHPP